MKRWMLDTIVGLLSLVVFLVLVLVLPHVISGDIGYLIALLLFVAVICSGGYVIRNVSP